jgi:hypothetical protein
MPLNVVTSRMAEDLLHRGPMVRIKFYAFCHSLSSAFQSNPGAVTGQTIDSRIIGRFAATT